MGNSTDTIALRRAFVERLGRQLDRSEAFDLDVSGRLVAMYLGGLDADKRIPFLLEAAARAHEQDPRFLLLLAGSGADQAIVQAAAAGGDWLAWIPRADQLAAADMAAVSSTIWMPGRVGLVAVDGMALGLTILTTEFPYHAPEFEFLEPGRDVQILPNDPKAFAVKALSFMESGRRQIHTDRLPAGTPSIDAVADRMLDVLDRIVR